MDSQFSQTNSMNPITINTINNQIINMYPSQNPDHHPVQTPKRKRIPPTSPLAHRNHSSPVPSNDLDCTHTPEFQLTTDTDTLNGTSKLDAHLIRDWRQIGSSWSERFKGWSQQESYWYRKMHYLYMRWSNDPNSDKSIHPEELSWAFVKLDQAVREVAYCNEWIAYAKWQIVSRTKGLIVGECPPLPSVEGRPFMVDKGRKSGEEENQNNKPVEAGMANRDLVEVLPHRVPAQTPSQALQALARNSLQDASQEQQRKDPVQSSQNPTYPRTPGRAPALAPATPSKAPSQVSQSPAQRRVKTPQTPARDFTKTPPQPPMAAKNPAQAFVKSLSQVPSPSPFQGIQTPQTPVSWQHPNTQNANGMPFLTFPEFVAQQMQGMPDQQDRQPARQTIHSEQLMQQPIQRSTQPARKPGRPLFQKPTQKFTQKLTKKPSQQSTKPVGRPPKKPTQKSTQNAVNQVSGNDPIQNTPESHNSPMVPKEAPLPSETTALVEPCEKLLPLSTNPNLKISASPSAPCKEPAQANSEALTPKSDWWNAWVLESEADADCVRFQGEELDKLMEDLSGPTDGVEGSAIQVKCP